MHVVSDSRDPVADVAILIILHQGRANTRGRVFERAPPLQTRGRVLKGVAPSQAARAHLHFKRGAAEVPRVHKSHGRQHEETQRAPLTFNHLEYLL